MIDLFEIQLHKNPHIMFLTILFFQNIHIIHFRFDIDDYFVDIDLIT